MTDIPEGQVVGNHGNWLLETGSLIPYPKAGWRPDEGAEGGRGEWMGREQRLYEPI